MKTELAILAMGALLLLPVVLMEPSKPLFRFRLLAFILAGAIVSQFALDGTLHIFGLVRSTDFFQVIHSLKPIDKKRPTLVLLGSSYTARNADGVYLEKRLKDGGLDYQVRQMSYPGIYAYEQDYYLDGYLSEYPPPDLLLVELGTEHSLTVKAENFLKHSTIEFHDPERMWILLSNLARSDDRNIWGDAMSVLTHGLARGFHLGILHALQSRQSGKVRAGFLPEESGVDAPNIDVVHKGLYQPVAPPPADDYRAEFRKTQEKRLLRSGIRKVVFWQPPSVSPEQRIRTGSLCKALRSRCLEFDAPALLDGAFWTDSGHLNAEGARRLTDWLANRLEQREELAHVVR